MTAPQIDTARLPLAVESGAQWSLTTLTQIKSAYGGTEARKAKRVPRWEASLTINPEEIEDIIDLYYSQVGPRWAIAARNNVASEYSAFDQLLEPDDDGNYPVVRQYGSGARERTRRIYIPIPGTIVVELDGTPISSAHWTLTTPGIIVPSSSPDQNWDAAVVTASYDYDTPMRFADDRIDFSVFTESTAKSQIRMIEVL